MLSNALNSGGSKTSGERETESPLVQNINETTASVNTLPNLESSTTLAIITENNTVSSTNETTEMPNHTDSSTIAQSTHKPPDTNKAASTIQLSIYVCLFSSLFIRTFL